MKILALFLLGVWLVLAWLVFFFEIPKDDEKMIRHIEEVEHESALGTWETYEWKGEGVSFRYPEELVIAESDASVVGVMVGGGGTIILRPLQDAGVLENATKDDAFSELHILHQSALVRFDESAPYEDVVIFEKNDKPYEARISYAEKSGDTWSVLYRVLTTLNFEY